MRREDAKAVSLARALGLVEKVRSIETSGEYADRVARVLREYLEDAALEAYRLAPAFAVGSKRTPTGRGLFLELCPFCVRSTAGELQSAELEAVRAEVLRLADVGLASLQAALELRGSVRRLTKSVRAEIERDAGSALWRLVDAAGLLRACEREEVRP